MSRHGLVGRWRPLLPILAVLLLLLLRPLPADAHAQVIGVEPADGSRVAVGPVEAVVRFDGPVALAPEGLRVLDGAGRVMDEGAEAVTADTVRQRTVSLPDGWYVVTWGIVSEDGHIVRGASVFGVGDVEAASRPSLGPDTQEALTWLARSLGDLGLLVASGAWFAWWVLRADLPEVRRLAVLGSLLGAIASASWVLLQFGLGGQAWLTTAYGLSAVARVGLLTVAVVTARRTPLLATICTALALLALAVGGHATDDTMGAALQIVHMAAGAVWLGAAPAMVLVVRDRGLDELTTVGIIRGFSQIAGIALLAVGIGGLATAWLYTDGFAGGLLQPYPLVVLAKAAVVVVAAVLGWWGRRTLMSAAPRPRYSRLFALDAAILVVVALLSGALTMVTPHAGHAGHDMSVRDRCVMDIAGSSASAIVSPAKVGENDLLVGGVGADVQAVTAALAHPLAQGASIEVPLRRAEDMWQGSTVLPFEGTWTLTVEVRETTFTTTQGSCVIGVGR